ncbi:hypothetical protein NMY22_g11032 [Coprinellus aureogranulatus]|nr:hypothetical protein NMY22_g11032 [Coprinellus aureogranulatus]
MSSSSLALDLAIRQRTSGPLEAPLKRVGPGWLYDLNGESFYSPNCYRPGLTEPSEVPSGLRGGIVNGREFDIEFFRRPQWYTKAHGYFGFMPLHPNLQSPGLDALTRIPFPVYDRNTGVHVPHHDIYKSWKNLQKNLVQSCHLLLHDSRAPNVRTVYPCARVDNLQRPTKGVLKDTIFKAGQWFEVWMGCLSYAIAVSEALHKPRPHAPGSHAPVPYWMDLLLQPLHQRQQEWAKKKEAEEFLKTAHVYHPGKDFDHLDPDSFLQTPLSEVVDSAFVNSLRCTCIARFDDTIERVGLFVKLPTGSEASDSISIDWLCQLGVPVFYPWGDREKEKAKNDNFWERYAPPDNVVQVPWPFKDSLPANVDGDDDDSFEEDACPSPPSTRSLQQAAFRKRPKHREVPPIQDRVWDVRIAQQEADGAKLLAIMSERDKKDVSMRQQHPPTAQSSTKKQAHYNAVFNEWDICEFLGVPDDSQIRFRARTDADAFGVPEEEALAYWQGYFGVSELVMEEPVEDVSMGDISMDAGVTQAEEEGEVLEEPTIVPSSVTAFAYQHLGFTIPPGTSIHQAAHVRGDPVKLGFAPRLLGIGAKDNQGLRKVNFWESTEGRALADFANAFQGLQPPSPNSWDVRKENHMPVASTSLFKKLQRNERAVRIQKATWDNVKGKDFAWKEDSGIYYWLVTQTRGGWFLGSLTATVALVMCRQTVSEPLLIALTLAGRGIPFRTWYSSKKVSRSVRFSESPNLIQYRHEQYKFTVTDFENYERSLRILLDGPAGRASIRMGGIVWKIALDVGVSIPGSLEGNPSREALEGQRLARRCGDTYFVDDWLNEDESDAICGTYELTGGPNGQRSRVSWFPPADLWADAYGPNGWTSLADYDFAKRKREILAGAEPLSRNKWREKLKQSGSWGRAWVNIEKCHYVIHLLNLGPQASLKYPGSAQEAAQSQPSPAELAVDRQPPAGMSVEGPSTPSVIITVNNVSGHFFDRSITNVSNVSIRTDNDRQSLAPSFQNEFDYRPHSDTLSPPTPVASCHTCGRPQQGVPFPTSGDPSDREEGTSANEEHRMYKRKRVSGSSKSMRPQNYRSHDSLDLLLNHVAGGATHDSAERAYVARCHPSTREAVQEEIHTWGHRREEKKKKVLWITGPAGTGKTSIAKTIAGRFKKVGLLAAEFFFSGLSQDHALRTQDSLITTLAYQLIQQDRITGLREEVLIAIDNDPHVFKKSLPSQLESLILAPLRKVHQRPESDPSTWPNIILVDGVDECQGKPGQRSAYLSPKAGRSRAPAQLHHHPTNNDACKEVVSTLIQAVEDPAFPFRVIIVSRPEPIIRRTLGKKRDMFRELFLGDHYKPDADIALYLDDKFAELREHCNLPESWPSEQVKKKLIRNASGQFVYATTVMRVLENGNKHPNEQLQMILAWDDNDQPGECPLAPLDGLYTRIIQTSPDPRLAVKWLHAILELQTENNESRTTVKAFLESQPGETEFLLRNLSSLLCIRRDGSPLRVFHKSLLDFLGSPRRSGSGNLYVSPETVSNFLHRRWYDILQNRGPQISLTGCERRTFLTHYVESFTTRYFYLPRKGAHYTPDDVSWWTDMCVDLLSSRCHQLRVESVHEIVHEMCAGPWFMCESDCNVWRKNLRTPSYSGMLSLPDHI